MRRIIERHRQAVLLFFMGIPDICRRLRVHRVRRLRAQTDLREIFMSVPSSDGLIGRQTADIDHDRVNRKQDKQYRMVKTKEGSIWGA